MIWPEPEYHLLWEFWPGWAAKKNRDLSIAKMATTPSLN